MISGHNDGLDQNDAASIVLHASCVAFDGRAVLILGASGRGKSALALQLMALGAGLVADDRTCLTMTRAGAQGTVIADAPPPLRGLIEARGIGLLHAEAVGPCDVDLVIDLDQAEVARLPEMRHMELLGQQIRLLHRVDSPSFPAAILQYLKVGRYA